MLSACAYTPLYQDMDSDSMSQVRVGDVGTKAGVNNVGAHRAPQLLAQKLTRAFPGQDGRYTLSVTLEEKTSALATSRSAADQRYQFELSAHLLMVNGEGEKMLNTRLRQYVAYNVQATGYATDSEAEAARTRAVDRLSEEIIQQVHYKIFAMEHNETQ